MDNLNTISYDEGWKDAYTPVHQTKKPEKEVSEKQVKEKKKTNFSIPLLTIIQLVICFIAVVAAFGLKIFGGDLYQAVHNWYYEQLSDEIIMNESFDSFSLNSFTSLFENNINFSSDNDAKD